MTRVTYINKMPYEYNASARGTKYTVNGRKKNHGQWLESVVKFHLGIEFADCPSVDYKSGSDIESTKTSVKSGRATLATNVVGETFEEIKEEYFRNVHSDNWIFVEEVSGKIYEYHMNQIEFSEFLDRWHTLDRETKTHTTKIRIKHFGTAMHRWLENRI